jgi:hypothetical protein
MIPLNLGHITQKGLATLLFADSITDPPRVYIPGRNGWGKQENRLGTFSAIEREDGSGRSFNVTVRLDSHEVVQVHVRVK